MGFYLRCIKQMPVENGDSTHFYVFSVLSINIFDTSQKLLDIFFQRTMTDIRNVDRHFFEHNSGNDQDRLLSMPL